MRPITLERLVLRTIREHRLAAPADRIIVAVSGGRDSMALLDLLHTLAQRRDTAWQIHVAHLDHAIRGAAAKRDAAFVARQAAARSLPFHTHRINIPRLARRHRRGLEEQSRLSRYEFLTRLVTETGAQAIALAHHADDQAETILHHLIRGTGWHGLAGMPITRPIAPDSPALLIRPLLHIRRETIRDYIAQRNIPFRTDASNRDPRHTRNRIRHRLLPMLQKQFNPGIVDALLRLGRQAAYMSESITRRAADMLRTAKVPRSSATADPCELAIQLDAWRSAEPLVQTEAIRLALDELRAPLGEITFERLHAVMIAFSRGMTDGIIEMPGRATARRRGRNIVIRATPAARSDT